MNGQNNSIQKWIGRITATVISGVAIAFLTGRINSHKDVGGIITEPSPSPDQHLLADGRPQINRGNVETYFSIEKIYFKKGFENGDSSLAFLVEAKGSFGGNMRVKKYDRDGVITNYSSLVHSKSKALFLGTSWVSGERDWAYFYVKPNISKVELYFEQTR